MHMREEDVMRATDIGMVPLGYGRFVRADDIVAVLPIEEGRGRGRRTHVHVAGLAAPLVASRSEEAILADKKAARGPSTRGTIFPHISIVANTRSIPDGVSGTKPIARRLESPFETISFCPSIQHAP